MAKTTVPVSLGLVALLCVSSFPVLAQSQASEKSVSSLQAVIQQLTKARAQVQGTLDSLTALSSGGDANLTKNYNTYSKNVSALAKSSEAVKARAVDMKNRREAYLQEWQKKSADIKDPAIQAHMQARAEQVKTLFGTIQPATDALKQAFPPFLSYLQDLDKVLSVDLSSAGLTAAAPLVEKAKAEGTTVATSLDTMVATLTQVSNQISPKTKK